MFGKLFLLALAALGIMMAVPSTRTVLEDRARPVTDNLKAKLVPRRLEVMADQLEVRVGRGESFPSNWEGWLRRDFSGAPEDPWGAIYYFRTGRSSFTVGSKGPDGEPNTQDDIKVERRLAR